MRMRSRFPLDVATIAALTGVYFVAAKLGLKLAFVHASATSVWPPTGIALAAFLMLGYRVWPGIFLGAFLANLTTEGTVATSLGIAVGNTLEGLVGASLIDRFAGGRHAFERPQDILKFAVLAGMGSTTVSATFGVTSLLLGGFAQWSDSGAIWLTWWLGDATGALIVTPLLLLWSRDPRVRWERHRLVEAVFLLASLALVGEAVFGGFLPDRITNHSLEFLTIPILLWAAYRFGMRETATAACALSGLAIWGTLHGFGPFARGTANESLLVLQAFMGVTTVLAIAFAAVVAESRRGVEARVRLASIVETSDDAIIGKTIDGRILSWNSGATRLYGYTAEEMIGRPISILAPLNRRDEVPRVLDRIGRGGRVEHFETLRVRKDGRHIAVSLTISPVTDAAGRILGASTIARNVTERMRADEAARRTEALLSVTRLANAAAHEINNPLSVIVGQLELLLMKIPEDDPQSRQRLVRALEAATQIHEIVDRMQHIMKLETADQPAGLPERLDLMKSTPLGEIPQ